jgi:hypothetical protein
MLSLTWRGRKGRLLASETTFCGVKADVFAYEYTHFSCGNVCNIMWRA